MEVLEIPAKYSSTFVEQLSCELCMQCMGAELFHRDDVLQGG